MSDELPTGIETELLRILDGPSNLQAEHLDALCAKHPECAETIRRAYATGWRTAGESVPEPSARLVVGTQLGAYTILGTLGEGGMGVVYLAEQKQPVRRRVALKAIKLGMGSREVLARFDLERRALAAMNHEAVAKVFDAGTTPLGQPYFVMELVQGLPITEYCDKHRLTITERLELFQRVCEGVHHAHQKGVVHRDLKPDNVLVVRRGDQSLPKILDFGLAKATNLELVAQTIITVRDQVMGTPEYMAPEQVVADDEVIDARADIYSLGVLLYEMLAGALPFTRKDLARAGWLEIRRILSEVEPAKPSSKVTTLPPDTLVARARARGTPERNLSRVLRGDLDWIVMKAMAKEPARRYESATALAADLGRYLTHDPVTAGPPSVAYRLRKFGRKYRGQLVAASLLLVVLIAGGITSTVLALRNASLAQEAHNAAADERSARISAQQALRDVQIARLLAASGRERRSDPTLSLLLALEAVDHGGRADEDLYGALAEMRELAGFQGGHRADPMFADLLGDDTVVSLDYSGTICWWSIKSRDLLRRVELDLDDVRSALLSRSGQYLAVIGDERVLVVESATGRALNGSRTPSKPGQVAVGAGPDEFLASSGDRVWRFEASEDVWKQLEGLPPHDAWLLDSGNHVAFRLTSLTGPSSWEIWSLSPARRLCRRDWGQPGVVPVAWSSREGWVGVPVGARARAGAMLPSTWVVTGAEDARVWWHLGLLDIDDPGGEAPVTARGRSVIDDLFFRPDDRQLYLSDWSGPVAVGPDASERVAETVGNAYEWLALSPDRSRLAADHAEGAQVIDATSLRPLFVLPCGKRVRGFRFLSDGRMLTWCRGGGLQCWEESTWLQRRSITPPDPILDTAVAADGATVCFVTGRREAWVYDWRDPARGHRLVERDCAFAVPGPGGEWLLLGGSSHVFAGRVEQRLLPAADRGAFSGDGAWVALGQSEDVDRQGVQLYDRSRDRLTTLSSTAVVHTLWFDHRGMLHVLETNGTCRSWDLTTGMLRATLAPLRPIDLWTDHDDTLASVSATGRRFLAPCDGTLWAYDLDAGSVSYLGQWGAVDDQCGFAMSPDGRCAFAATGDSPVVMFDVTTLARRLLVTPEVAAPYHVECLPGSVGMVCCHSDGRVAIVDTDDGSLKWALSLPGQPRFHGQPDSVFIENERSCVRLPIDLVSAARARVARALTLDERIRNGIGNTAELERARAILRQGFPDSERDARMEELRRLVTDTEWRCISHERPRVADQAEMEQRIWFELEHPPTKDPERLRAAVDSARRLVARSPRDRYSRLLLGIALLHRGDLDDSAREFEQARTLDGQDWLFGVTEHVHLALGAHRSGRPERARALLEQARTILAEHPWDWGAAAFERAELEILGDKGR